MNCDANESCARSHGDTVIAQFAKAPVLGKVKTRLAEALSDAEKLALHKQLVQHSAELLRRFSQENPSVDIQLWVTAKDSFFSSEIHLDPEWIHVQEGSDLGQRMENMFLHNLKTYKKVIVIGSDCPFLQDDDLNQARAALENHDCVIAPARDGGYVMLGLKQYASKLFTNIDWGTSRVFEQTMQLAQEADLSVKVAREFSDIDRAEDLPLLDAFPFKLS